MTAAAASIEDPTTALRQRVQELERERRAAERELRVSQDELREYAEEEAERERLAREVVDAEVPAWLDFPTGAPKTGPGVPTLFLSDWHWAERVRFREIGGSNEYNLAIAHRRAMQVFTGAIDLLSHHMVRPEYPGIVVPFGGDMVDWLLGHVHAAEENANEVVIRESLRDIAGVLVGGLLRLADEYGNVFVPIVPGNHGRLSRKMPNKQTAGTNLDAILGDKLADRLGGDKRFTFAVSYGSDLRYRIYGVRFLLTHGWQFKGGDSIIGAAGPLIRGDRKYRNRNAAIGHPYDVLLVAHFHHHMLLPGPIIANGSLKGYDEFAYNSGFPFQAPIQALFVTHPLRGVTCHWPVQADPKPAAPAVEPPWVSLDAIHKE